MSHQNFSGRMFCRSLTCWLCFGVKKVVRYYVHLFVATSFYSCPLYLQTVHSKKYFLSKTSGLERLPKSTTGDRTSELIYVVRQLQIYESNLHPGISVSSCRGGTVSSVLAYFLAAWRCACRASISFLVLGIRHLNIQHRVITE